MMIGDFEAKSEGNLTYKFSSLKLSSIQNLPADVKQKFDVGMKFDNELNRFTCFIPENSEAAWV